MRISDWSSDVCSSDLSLPRPQSPASAWHPSLGSLLAVPVMAPAQRADELQLRLEVDVVRQLQVLHEAGGLDAVGVVEHELLVLRRILDAFIQLARPQRAVDQARTSPRLNSSH